MFAGMAVLLSLHYLYNSGTATHCVENVCFLFWRPDRSLKNNLLSWQDNTKKTPSPHSPARSDQTSSRTNLATSFRSTKISTSGGRRTIISHQQLPSMRLSNTSHSNKKYVCVCVCVVFTCSRTNEQTDKPSIERQRCSYSVCSKAKPAGHPHSLLCC